MIEDIGQIEKMRKNFGLTQKELAKYSGVSQSLIAKIESGRIDPSYSKVMKIFSALDGMSKKMDVKARDIMTTKIISVSPDESIKKAIRKMKDHNISQLPVMDNRKPVGRVTESDILEALTGTVSLESPVEAIMDDEAPVVSVDASLSLISSLSKHYNFVLVSEKGRIAGVITKSDILTKGFR